MIIGLGKFGKSTQFCTQSVSKKSMVSGAIDAPMIYRQLLKYNPEHEFVMLGLSDWSRLNESQRSDIAPHDNLYDPWLGFKERKKQYKEKGMDERLYHIEWMKEWMESTDKRVDVSVMLPGHMLPLGVQGKSVNHKGTALANCLMASSAYAGPLYYYFNENPHPYLMLVTDPRVYPGLNEDLFVTPSLVLSQYSETYEVKHRTRYDSPELVSDEVEAVYSGIESLYVIKEEVENRLFDDEVEEIDPDARDISMMLFLNEGNPSRYDDVMKYVLGESNEIPIYGKWKHPKALEDPRFEEIPMATLSHLFHRIKYTFCIPIKPGWATGKFWDMIDKGIIPFVHPTYDTQRNIGFPEWLRIESAEDLKNKMDYLDSNPEEYVKLRRSLEEMITPDHRSGKKINDTIMNALEKIA